MDLHCFVNCRLFEESVSTVSVQKYEKMITFHKIVKFIYEMAWPILSFYLGIPWEGGGSLRNPRNLQSG